MPTIESNSSREDVWASGFDLRTSNRPRTETSQSAGSANVVIGEGTKIVGELRLSGQARINAVIEGEIFSDGEVTIGEKGVVEGQIRGAVVRISGKVTGDITATSRIELLSGAQLRGDISSPSLVIQDGVVFEGYCRMNHVPGAAAAAKDQSSLSSQTTSSGEASTKQGGVQIVELSDQTSLGSRGELGKGSF